MTTLVLQGLQLARLSNEAGHALRIPRVPGETSGPLYDVLEVPPDLDFLQLVVITIIH